MYISTVVRSVVRSALLMGSVTTVVFAQMGKRAVNVDDAGVALKGYDAVAYHTNTAPTLGSSSFTATHDGATYRFASAANRDTFVADPAKYVPAYGGYCAVGVAFGKKFDIDPTAFRVVDGTLYLNKDPSVQRLWLRDVPGNITKANERWTDVKVQPGFAR